MSKLELELGTTAWVRDCLNSMVVLKTADGFWRRRLDSAVIFFQVLLSSGGRFALVSLESFEGRKARIFIPKGSKKKGWSGIAGELTGFLPTVIGNGWFRRTFGLCRGCEEGNRKG